MPFYARAAGAIDGARFGGSRGAFVGLIQIFDKPAHAELHAPTKEPLERARMAM